jgi:hypothetical protein
VDIGSNLSNMEVLMQDERQPQQDPDEAGYRLRTDSDEEVEAHRHFLNEPEGEEESEGEDEIESHRWPGK